MPTTSPNMALVIPSYQDPSPGYVSNFANALGTLDAHDHSTGKGLPVTPAGLNINADLPFAQNNATNLRSVRLYNNAAPLATSSDKASCYVSGGNLYYNNATGTPVQITSGAGLNAAATGGIGGQYTSAGALVSYSDTTKTYSFYGPFSAYAALSASNVAMNNAAPSATLNCSTVGRAFRMSAYNSELRFSLDYGGLGHTDATNGQFTDLPNMLVLVKPSASALLGGLGINVNPTSAGPVGGAATFGVYNGTSGPTYTAVFYNPNDQALCLVGGATATSTNNRSACLILYSPVSQCDIGVLSSLGASNTGGSQGDFAIRLASTENVFVIRKSNQCIGMGLSNPVNKLDVATSATVGYGGSPATMPTNSFGVSGMVFLGAVSTTQRNAGASVPGQMCYNTTTARFEFCMAGTWYYITGASLGLA